MRWRGVLMKIVHACLIVVATLIGIPLLLIVVGQFSLNRQAEAKAWSQLTDHYRTTDITQNDRVYFGPEGSYYYFYAQICYDVSVRSPSGAIVRKVAMVVGDDDGGSFNFSGEFSSMMACEAKFNHG
jgi:hypothetical protein